MQITTYKKLHSATQKVAFEFPITGLIFAVELEHKQMLSML